MIKLWNIRRRAFRQQGCRRAFAPYSSAILACGVVATIPNAACSKKTIAQEIVQQIPVEAPSSQSPASGVRSPSVDFSTIKVDLDMTKMSSTMIYAEVFNMLIMPEEYTDKVIKVKGNFQVFVSEETKQRFFTLLIPDATKCCQQGIEFIWPGDHSYPEDYPALGQEITITGTYHSVDNEEGITYNFMEILGWE